MIWPLVCLALWAQRETFTAINSLFFFASVDPTPSPQVTPVNNFLSSSLVADLEGLSLTDTVLAPTVSYIRYCLTFHNDSLYVKLRSFDPCCVFRPSPHQARWGCMSYCTGSQERVWGLSTASAGSRSALILTWWLCRSSSPTTPVQRPRTYTSKSPNCSPVWGSRSSPKSVSQKRFQMNLQILNITLILKIILQELLIS